MITNEEYKRFIECLARWVPDSKYTASTILDLIRMGYHIASEYSELSPDEETKVGAVVMQYSPRSKISFKNLGEGRNTFPSSCSIDKHLRFPSKGSAKYPYMVHAEVNALMKALASGGDLSKSILICTLSPCVECAKMIANTSLCMVIYGDVYNEEGLKMLEKFGKPAFSMDTVDLPFF